MYCRQAKFADTSEVPLPRLACEALYSIKLSNRCKERPSLKLLQKRYR